MIPTVNGWHAVLAALLFLGAGWSRAAEDLPGAAHELARKTAALGVTRSTVTIDYRSLSTLPPSVLVQLRREFEAALPAGNEGPAVQVRLTLSENSSQYLLIEEAAKGAEMQVWIAGWNRPAQALATGNGPMLEKKLVWEQDEPILDAAVLGNEMLVLAPSRLSLYQSEGAQWRLLQQTMLPANAWPRDTRGRLRMTGNRFQIFLPAVECRGVVENQLSLACHRSTDPWVLESGSHEILLAHFAPERNYFDGNIVLQDGSRQNVQPFYSAAATEDASGVSWLLTQLDGQTQAWNSTAGSTAAIPNWGSDIVGLAAPCLGGPQILATRASDSHEPDAIQAYSIVNRSAFPAGTPLTFPGPVTALWPATPASALAVARDPATEHYAAYLVTLACIP
ncbi:MAG: hypothetical protein JO323_10235 [Acidobacteriia bacterium]|nr:hypothetical protein [Terriglobia bacterium]